MPSIQTTRKPLIAAFLSAAFAVGVSAQPSASTGASGTASAMSSSAPARGASGGPLASADGHFVHEAAVGGLAEVALGNLAQQKASSDQVKQFGARMVQDHGKANDELKQIASSKSIQLPTSPDKKHQKEMEKMQKMTGARFDKAYMDHMLKAHRKDINDFKREANSGRDAEVKAFAAKTLPTLQEHLQLAQATQKAVKGGGK